MTDELPPWETEGIQLTVRAALAVHQIAGPDGDAVTAVAEQLYRAGSMTDAEIAAAYADALAGQHAAQRRAAAQGLADEWSQRTDEVLRLHIGLIDPELCAATGAFLAAEDWLIHGKEPLSNRHVLLIAKAVGYGIALDGDKLRATGTVPYRLAITRDDPPPSPAPASEVPPAPPEALAEHSILLAGDGPRCLCGLPVHKSIASRDALVHWRGDTATLAYLNAHPHNVQLATPPAR